MRILLVEDEPDAAALLARGLREQTYAVDVATDGDNALELIDLNPYDLVVLDVMLPGKDGFQVCREVRRQGLSVAILMLTARHAVRDRVDGLDSGADDYLVKPFDFRELLARVRALLRRGPALKPAVLRVGDLELDTRTRQVRRGDCPVRLTAKEYALLEYLMGRAGQVVTRSEISEHVWDERYDPFSNLIEVYIQRLRRKIDAGPGQPLILTLRGEGYRLAAEGEYGDA